MAFDSFSPLSKLFQQLEGDQPIGGPRVQKVGRDRSPAACMVVAPMWDCLLLLLSAVAAVVKTQSSTRHRCRHCWRGVYIEAILGGCYPLSLPSPIDALPRARPHGRTCYIGCEFIREYAILPTIHYTRSPKLPRRRGSRQLVRNKSL